MLVVDDFKDYEIIDSSNGMKLERWGNIYLLRPDPQVIWDNGNLLEKYPNIKDITNIKIIKEYVSKDNSSKLITDDFDYIVDTIDSIHDKLSLILEAVHKDIPIISSMGTGDKFDPTLFEVTDISKTSSCPFAHLLKSELKKLGIEHLKVIYSKEKPTRFRSTESSYRANASSISFVPSVAGLIISSEVVKDLIN